MKLMKNVLVVAGISLAIVGCGKESQKTMTASQIMNSGYLSSSCTTSQISMSLSDSNNSVVANGSSACFSSETLQGTNSGNGQLTNVVLSVTIASQAMTQSSQYGSGYSYYCAQNPYYCSQGSTTTQAAVTCTYTGTLSYSNNYISGQLSSQYYQQSGSSAQCPSTIILNGSLSG